MDDTRNRAARNRRPLPFIGCALAALALWPPSSPLSAAEEKAPPAPASAQSKAGTGKAAPGKTWEVKFFRGAKEGFFHMSVANGDLAVTFLRHHAWNICGIEYKGRPVNIQSGCTGTVLQWNDGSGRYDWAGSGHKNEELRDAYLLVDGKRVDVSADGKDLRGDGWSLTGREIVFARTGRIYSVQSEERFEFPADADFYTATHKCVILSPVSSDQWKGGGYSFMQMMPRAYSQWLALRADGSAQEGQIEETPPAGYRQRDADLGKIKGLVCYNQAARLGVAYAFPEDSPGACHLDDRPGKDLKLRCCFPRGLAEKTAFKEGEALEFTLKVIPFEAPPESWKEMGGAMVKGATPRP